MDRGLSRERHPAADLETVWGRVFRMAELESKRGKQIHVLDDQGRIVIGIGANRRRALRSTSSRGAALLRRMHDGVTPHVGIVYVDVGTARRR